MRDDFRAFRLDCIQSLVVAFESFEPHDMTIEEYYEELRGKYNCNKQPLTQGPVTFVINKNIMMQKVKIETFKVIGISVRTSNLNGQAQKDIGLLWQRLF